MQGPMERIEHETEILEGNHSEQCFGVVRIAKDHRGMSVPLGDRKVTLGDGP